jgi:imidazolonepropionase-like amidohydrolase
MLKRTERLRRVLVTGLHGLLLAAGLAFGHTEPAHADATSKGDLAIVNARIYPWPEAAPIDHGTVLIRGGKIAAVGTTVRIPGGTKTIDAGSAAVTSGFWNCHVHLITPGLLHAEKRSSAEISSELESMLTRWGFTTVFDLSSQLSNTNLIRRRVRSGEVTGPRILTVGDPFFPEGGTPIYARKYLEDNGFPNEEVATPEQAATRARRQLEEGADGVKIFAGAIVSIEGGHIGVLPMPLEIARAAVEEAHRSGKPAFAHPTNAQGVEVSIQSGVDVLAHTAPDMGPWSPELVARLQAHHMALIPTLTLFRVEISKAGAPPEVAEKLLQVAGQQVQILSHSGGQILFGTDVGYIDVYDTREEYQQLGRWLDYKQILASLTTSPAERFGGERGNGRIEPNAEADLVVLDGDPAQDVTAFARVRYTIKDGRVIHH